MQIVSLRIHHFKSIQDMWIQDIENALILVGQNNTGKTTVLDAIRAVGGEYQIKPEDFDEDGSNIEIEVSIAYGEEDFKRLQSNGVISKYRRLDAWKAEFEKKLPSFQNGIFFCDVIKCV